MYFYTSHQDTEKGGVAIYLNDLQMWRHGQRDLKISHKRPLYTPVCLFNKLSRSSLYDLHQKMFS